MSPVDPVSPASAPSAPSVDERDLVPADPFDLLRAWLPANEDPARPLMTLATTTEDGWPDARTVLLSEFDADGFCFHTDSRSRKIAEVDAVPRAALMIHLPELARQIVVQGTVETVPAEEEALVYGRRQAYLKVLAWMNTPELAALPLAERIEAWSSFCAEHPEATLTPPPTWTGRRVRPTRLLLWLGSEDTASRRLDYTRAGDGWDVTVLPG